MKRKFVVKQVAGDQLWWLVRVAAADPKPQRQQAYLAYAAVACEAAGWDVDTCVLCHLLQQKIADVTSAPQVRKATVLSLYLHNSHGVRKSKRSYLPQVVASASGSQCVCGGKVNLHVLSVNLLLNLLLPYLTCYPAS